MDVPKYNNELKKKMVREIEDLSLDEHIEIFKIIKQMTDKYTKNDNGVFVNVSILDDNIIHQIDRFVKYCLDNKKKFDKDEELMIKEKNKIVNKKNNLSEPTINDEEIVEIPDVSHIDDGAKISLKKTKPKYGGVKAKIIKTYKQSNASHGGVNNGVVNNMNVIKKNTC